MSELKAINAHGVRKDDGAYYDRRQADEYIAELDERHTTEITALEVSYRLQLDGLRYDKDAEIRRLKRALWLARAERSKSEKDYWGHIYNEDCGEFNYTILSRSLASDEWMRIWHNVELKCRAKAEEYK